LFITHPLALLSDAVEPGKQVAYNCTNEGLTDLFCGRKTTTMLFKMIGIERTARTDNERNIRQVFVTQSRVLAEKVQECFNDMMQSFAGNSQLSEESDSRANRRREIEKDLVELDEEDESLSNLPTRLSELEDAHFPLFVTFDKVQSILSLDLHHLIDFSHSYAR
jgi:hypothetical protein